MLQISIHDQIPELMGRAHNEFRVPTQIGHQNLTEQAPTFIDLELAWRKISRCAGGKTAPFPPIHPLIQYNTRIRAITEMTAQFCQTKSPKDYQKFRGYCVTTRRMVRGLPSHYHRLRMQKLEGVMSEAHQSTSLYDDRRSSCIPCYL